MTIRDYIDKPVILVQFYEEVERWTIAKGQFTFGAPWQNDIAGQLAKTNQKYLWFRRSDVEENGGTGHEPQTEVTLSHEINGETWIWI